ncbi:hypothetical protein [Streptomyces sp. NRRL F-5639]|uniref:hypothetical protein n=1 Tax=unclassified Streptomyces TaxID=2593676 RepID=UPI0004CB697B|nr:hypothetical protein [Streptomyces sp. NRRL F-5639]KPC90927.1 hypothetical protein ADL27_33280 [Streptomyces sp. NRRL F-6602]
MGRRTPNRQLAALLAESGWNAGELARAVNALGTKYGLRLRYDRTAVAHWLEGSRPRPPVPGLVAQVFGRRLGRVVHVGETGLARTAATGNPAEAVLGNADPVDRMTALCRADADPARRLALNRDMFAATGIRLPTWPPTAGPDTVVRPGGTAGPEPPGADPRLADVVTIFAELAEKYGGAHARSALGAYIADDIVPRLRTSPHTRTRDPEVLTGSACLMHLLGMMLADAGLPNLGYHCYRSALELAHRADNRNLYAITLRTMAVQALRLDDLTHARQWSQSALELAAPTATSPVRCYLLAGRAVVRAADGEREGALADLLAAERCHEAEADAGAGPLDLFTRYPPAAFRYQRGEVLLWLGDRAQAAVALQDSLAARPSAHHVSRLLTHAQLARTLLDLGQLDAALDQCRQAAAHYPHTSSRRTTTALSALRRSLAPYRRHPQAREVRDHLTRLTRPAPPDSGGTP